MYYLAIDLEALDNTHINGIGLVLGDEHGRVLLKKEWWIKVDEKEEVAPQLQRDRCKRDFWGKDEDLYKLYLEKALDEETQIRDFVNTYDTLHKIYGVEERQIKLISDNPEFDFGRLSPYVEKHCKRGPLRYTSTGDYRSITDIGQAMWYFGVQNMVKEAASKLQLHDHRPSNDAEFIYLSHIMAIGISGEVNRELGGDIKRVAKRKLDDILPDLKMKKQHSLSESDIKCNGGDTAEIEDNTKVEIQRT